MTSKQLADRIGGVDEELVQRSEGTSGNHPRRGGNIVGRILALAAVLALSASTFVVGALAFSRETIVEVEPEHQTIELETLGLTVLLPDSWKDRYIAKVENSMDDEGKRHANILVYCKAVYESDTDWKGSGRLFSISYDEGFFWTAQDFDNLSPAPGQYLFSTRDGTCILYYPGDVQYPPENEALSEEYQQMEQDVHEMKIILNRILP